MRKNIILLIIIRAAGLIFVIAGVVHWLIIFGVIYEKTPILLTYYFNSLAILNLIAGFNLILCKEFGRKVGLFIMLTQIPSHSYMIAMDLFYFWNSGVSILERIVDIVLSLLYIYVFSFNVSVRKFMNENCAV